MDCICVFCGSNRGVRPAYAQAARELGQVFAARGITLVYGGGRVGLMGAVADAVLAAGGKAIGVIPQALVEREVAHQNLTELVIVRSMHERKARMAELAQAFIALPGGYGTLEEFCEVLTWSQLGLHSKPCGLLNVDGYYDALLAFLDHSTSEGFVGSQQRGLVLEARAAEELLERLAQQRSHPLGKWIEP